MGAWAFVGLAYGIVWGTIIVYWFCLKRRYKDAESELARLKAAQESADNGKK
jgi:CcmD family protein